MERRPGETERDRDRRVFTAMMQESLSTYYHVDYCAPLLKCLDRFEDAPVAKMHWKKYLRSAIENEIRITDWPVEVMPPGPKFELKGLSTYALRMLVTGYIDYKLNGKPRVLNPRFEKWTQGM